MCRETQKNWRLDEKRDWGTIVPFDFFPQPSATVVVSDLTNRSSVGQWFVVVGSRGRQVYSLDGNPWMIPTFLY